MEYCSAFVDLIEIDYAGDDILWSFGSFLTVNRIQIDSDRDLRFLFEAG